MRHLLSTSLLMCVAVAATPGHAASLSTLFTTPLPADGAFYAPVASSSSGAYFEGVTGSTGQRTSPFSDTTTPYDSVGADGTATFGQGPLSEDTLVKAAFKAGPSSATFGSGSGTFSFVWGSPDTYNFLSFYENGGLIGTVDGSSAPSGGNGTGSYLATVTGIGDYNGVVFSSVGKNAFEFAAVSPVPLPASLPMFGGALLALVGFGYVARTRSVNRSGAAASNVS